MCFTRMIQSPTPIRIYIGRRALPRLPQIRYLGIIFTPRLSYHAHCDRVCASAMHAAFKITRVLTKTGPPPRIIRLLVQALVIPIISYGWPLWCPPTEKHWRRLETAVCLPLRCILGLPASTEKLALFVEFGLVRPALWRECSALVFAHRVDVELGKAQPNHPVHLLFVQQSRGYLPKRCPKYRIPFAKAVKTVEYRFDVDHESDLAARVASLRKRALARQIRQIRAPDEKRPTSRYAKELKLCPAPTSYILTDKRDIAVLRARIRLNRHHLRARQKKLKIVDDDRCPACVEFYGPQAQSAPSETVAHVLLNCPRFDLARMRCSSVLSKCDTSLTTEVLTGDCSAVSAQHQEDVQLATADFLQSINKIVPL